MRRHSRNSPEKLPRVRAGTTQQPAFDRSRYLVPCRPSPAGKAAPPSLPRLTKFPGVDTIGILKAKARLPEVVSRAEQGEPTVISKRGIVVARDVPEKEKRREQWDRPGAVDRIIAFGPTFRLSRKVSLTALIGKGRRSAFDAGRERGVRLNHAQRGERLVRTFPEIARSLRTILSE